MHEDAKPFIFLDNSLALIINHYCYKITVYPSFSTSTLRTPVVCRRGGVFRSKICSRRLLFRLLLSKRIMKHETNFRGSFICYIEPVVCIDFTSILSYIAKMHVRKCSLRFEDKIQTWNGQWFFKIAFCGQLYSQ